MFQIPIQAAIGGKIIARETDPRPAQGRHRQVLRRRRHPQAQAARQAEGRQEAHAPVRQGRNPAGGVHRGAEDGQLKSNSRARAVSGPVSSLFKTLQRIFPAGVAAGPAVIARSAERAKTPIRAFGVHSRACPCPAVRPPDYSRAGFGPFQVFAADFPGGRDDLCRRNHPADRDRRPCRGRADPKFLEAGPKPMWRQFQVQANALLDLTPAVHRYQDVSPLAARFREGAWRSDVASVRIELIATTVIPSPCYEPNSPQPAFVSTFLEKGSTSF